MLRYKTLVIMVFLCVLLPSSCVHSLQIREGDAANECPLDKCKQVVDNKVRALVVKGNLALANDTGALAGQFMSGYNKTVHRAVCLKNDANDEFVGVCCVCFIQLRDSVVYSLTSICTIALFIHT